MKIYEKISQLKKNIQDVHILSKKIESTKSFKNKIEELNNEILSMKRGISESVEELEEFLGEEDAGN